MIDHLHGNSAGFRFVERPGQVAVQGGPGFLIYFGLQGRLESLVGVVGAQEVGVADEETFFVVVGIDEPAGDAFGPVGADFAGVGVEHVHAVDFDLYLVVFGVKDVYVRFAEDDEQVPLAGVLQVVGHV